MLIIIKMKKKKFLEKNVAKWKNAKKTLNFLRGPTTKVKPQFDENYCEKQNKRTFFRIKKKFQVSIKEIENSWF